MLLLFIIKGKEPDIIGRITLSGYPVIFRFILAPIVDSYYINKFGRRKTYLVGIGFV